MFRKISVSIILTAAMLVIAPSVFAANSNYVTNRAPLANTAFTPLPLGSIKARGWLLKQLELQRGGLTGNAEAVYPELGKDSAWLGGKAPDSDWERPTYYTRGLIPLAYTLGDASLIAKAKKWMDAAIKSQRPDGSFGPPENSDWWARMPMLIALEDYYEASGDKRVVPFLEKYFKYQDEKTPDGLGYWGAARAADNIQAVIWLYNRNGDQKLLGLMDKIRKLTEDWTSALLSGSMGDNHGVNVAEGFKMPPVWYQRSLDAKDKTAFMIGHENAMRLHGQVHDLPSCTEFMAGKSSLQGVELCSIVDRIFSDGIAMTILGDAKIGDITEKFTFNALPGGTSRSMRQHQYYIIPNQAQNVFGPKGIYGQDYENALCPSTRSGVPCCCFNWHMGWPKFVQFSWAATSDNGLAALTYGPMEVKAQVSGGIAKFAEETHYPFSEQIRLIFSGAKPVKCPLWLRIPEWCKAPVVEVNGVAQKKVSSGTFFIINRQWKTGDVVMLSFPMELKITNQINNSVAIERGPLVFSLKIGEDWVKRVPMTVNGMDFSEYEVKPTTPWNYGLIIDQENLAASIKVNKKAMPADPFIQADAPITLSIKAKKIPTWVMEKNGLPQEVPQGPLNPSTPVEEVTLVPFGAENIRITYFPVISSASPAQGLTGEYFNGADFKELRITKTDPNIELHFGTGSPDPAVSAERYSIRWTGQIKPRYSGTSIIVVTTNGNAELWIEGKTVQQLRAHVSGMPAFTAPELIAGKWYDIKLEFGKWADMADVSLQWQSDKQPLEVVPATCLRPREAAGLEAQYKFDEIAGDVAADSSGYGRDARLSNTTLGIDGRNGGGVIGCWGREAVFGQICIFPKQFHGKYDARLQDTCAAQPMLQHSC
ncbi:MAG: glycoside hydrolase family 127 protein [Armatimonadetes bacterium]|nr:glycoside hydrolase family 127 protein [Armatimonadota bacterium]